MASPQTLLLAFLFGTSPPVTGDAACDRIREKERHAYCHCLTAQGGKTGEAVISGRLALSREPGTQAAVMSCMEKRGYGV